MANFKRKFIALLCSAAMAVTSISVTPPTMAEAKVLDGLADVSRQVTAEGCVLIKNDNNVLPLEGGEKIAVFGRAQCNYYKSGTGSGGAVIAPYVTGILEGLRKNPKVEVNEELAGVYTEWVKTHPFDNGGGGWAAEPWYQAEMPMTQEIADAAKEKSDTAVVLIGRTAGEDKDSQVAEGSYLLTSTEKEMLEIVSNTFDKVVVVLNTGNIMDMAWVDDYDIDSIMYVWQGGMSGGDAVADVLTGDVNPSGRLADTIAKSYSDYPSAKHFGRTDYNYYVEDIYVGYRYFETFAKDKVAYPFGYGLSYTTFETSTYSVTESNGKINVFTTVENTGDRAGKETVQVYYGAPQGTLGNPLKELAAFAKTKVLQPGESQDITISFDIADMASYDDSGVTGHDSCYVLEAGDYNIFVGNDVAESKLEYVYTQDELLVVEELEEEMAPVKAFQRMKPEENEDGSFSITYEDVPLQTVNVVEKIENNLPDELEKLDNKHYDLIDVYNGKLTTEQFVAQLSNEELTSLVRGEGMSPANVTPGVAAAFGGVNTKTPEGEVTTLTDLYGIPRAACADGPSGIRSNDTATSLPNGAAIACTWNTDLVELLFELEGKEMVMNEIDALLGPGINLHRNPLNGRNFEYFSEDPLLTGVMASAVTKGIQSTGATVTLKHFAANNQETNRHVDDSRVSERALRELYLKCFEIAVKTSEPRAVMTAYNPVNGCWTASNYDLTTDILRKEWGYTGFVMTDWWAEMNKSIGDGTKTTNGTQYLASMVKAQNDVYMVTPDSANEKNNSNRTIDIPAELESGYLKRSELQRCGVNICNYLLKSQALARLNGIEFVPYESTVSDWFEVDKEATGNPRLSGITVGGREITTFNPYVLEYKVYKPGDVEEIQEVCGIAAKNENVVVEQATNEAPVALIRVTGGGEETIYRVIFTDEEGLEPVFDNPIYASVSDIRVNGETVDGFDPTIYDYAIPVDSLSEIPEVTFSAPDDVVTSMTYDEANNQATIKCSSVDQVKYYRVRFGVRPQDDNFDGETLNDFWSIESENPETWALEDGHLCINSERGSLYQDQNDGKNQFVQPAFGDWEAVAKLDLEKLPWANYQSIGIVAKQDDDNYIYLKTEYANGLTISFTEEINGTRNVLEELSNDDKAKFTNTIYFKLKKLGNTYTAAVSPDGENYISFTAPASGEYSNPKFGFTAGHGSVDADSIKAAFDFVKFDTNIKTPMIQIGDSTKLKVAEEEPIAISKVMKPTKCEDEDGGLNFTNCNKGEYATYNVNVAKTGIYDFTARMASAASDTAQVKVIIYVDDVEATSFVTNGTGGAQSWVTSVANKVKLTAGEHKYKVYFDMAGMNLNWIQMDLTEEIQEAGLKEAIEAAEVLDITKYEAMRQEAFKEALAHAKDVLNNALSQKEIDDAVKTLKEAQDNLPKPEPIKSITIDVSSIALKEGSHATIGIKVVPAQYTEKLVWSSSNTKIATVDENGVVTAVKEGRAEITVSNGGDVKASVVVVVTKTASVPVVDGGGAAVTTPTKDVIKNVEVTLPEKTLYAGGNTDKNNYIKFDLPKDAVIKSVEYTTSDSRIATVNKAGKITAKGAGTVEINAKVTLTNGEEKTYSFKVNVANAQIQKKAIPSNVKAGKKVTLKADALGTSEKVTWKIKKGSKYGTITKSGKFTAKKKGTVIVVATAGDITKTFTIKVK